MGEVSHVQIASIWIDVSIRQQHNSSAQLTRHPVEEGADVTDHVRLMPDQIVIEGVVTNQPIELPGSHMDGATVDEGGFTLQRESALPTGVTSVTIEGEPTLGFLGLLPGVDQGATLLRTVGLDVRSKRRFEMMLPRLDVRARRFQANALRFSKPFDRVKAVYDALQSAFVARRPVQIVTGLRVYPAVVLIDLSIMRDAKSAGTLQFGCTGEVIRIVKSDTSLAGVPQPEQVRALPAVHEGNQNTVPAEPAEVDHVTAFKQIFDAGKAALHL